MGKLFVYVPAIGGRTELWDRLCEQLAKEPECAGARFVTWPEQARDRIGYLTWQRLEGYSEGLSARIDQLVRAAQREGKAYDEVVLIGNSIGSLVVRYAWLLGSGRLNQDVRPWAAMVTRIVLVSGISRGYVTRRRNSPGSLPRFGIRVLTGVFGGLRFSWTDALAGSAFVTNLRLTWMRYLSEIRASAREPIVVQLEGVADSMVEREDSRDVEQFPNAVHYIIAGAQHGTVLDLSGPDGGDRYGDLREAILHPLTPTTPPPPREGAAKDVVFLMHGIRAGVADWPRDMAALIQAKGGPDWFTVTPTYRYFSALAFALPFTRRRKVRWFLDQYSRYLARHLTARMHFVGHSNGTYLLGRAMEIPAVRFDRVYLASSVLHADFDWTALMDDPAELLAGDPARRQIGLIRCDRGSTDMAVGIATRGLRWFPGRDKVGGGGFEGFSQLWTAPAVQWLSVPGGHGAPLNRSRQDGIAEFVITGKSSKPDDLIDPSNTLKLLSRLSGVLLWLGLALLGGLTWWAFTSGNPFGITAILIFLALALGAAVFA